MDNRIPYTAAGHDQKSDLSTAAAGSVGSFVNAQPQQNELELLLAEQHRHQQQQEQRGVLHDADVSIPHERK